MRELRTMSRYFMTMGTALAIVIGVVTLSTTDARAVEEATYPAYFHAGEIDAEETAKIDGEGTEAATGIALAGGRKLVCKSTDSLENWRTLDPPRKSRR
jgi:hypothetical protein